MRVRALVLSVMAASDSDLPSRGAGGSTQLRATRARRSTARATSSLMITFSAPSPVHTRRARKTLKATRTPRASRCTRTTSIKLAITRPYSKTLSVEERSAPSTVDFSIHGLLWTTDSYEWTFCCTMVTSGEEIRGGRWLECILSDIVLAVLMLSCIHGCGRIAKSNFEMYQFACLHPTHQANTASQSLHSSDDSST